MKIYPRQVKKILDTLPIGYYANCRVPMTLDEEGNSSYIDLIDRHIVIGFKLIEAGMAKVEDESYLESAIRAMLYHEVSHAMLTPKCLKVTDINNIFEDERIETILSNFFMNVDFKKNIKLINDWDSYCMTRPKNAMDAFYRAVRFRVGKKEWLETIEKVIKEYYDTTSADECAWDYEYRIKEVYNMIARDFPSTPTSEMTAPPQNGEGDGKSGSGEGAGRNTSDMRKSEAGNSEGKQGEGEGEGKGEGEGQGEGQEGNEQNQSDMDGKGGNGDFNQAQIDRIRKLARKVLKSVSNGYCDPSLEQTLGRIIDSFNKKTASGSAMQSYSGVINPRLVGRPDYRIFERSANERGANKFGTVHLNLFLDESGSYYSNQEETNKLIASLAQIERTNKNFSFDIVYCGEGERLCDKKHRTMVCGGGNRLDDEVFKLYRDLQKPNTYNYNIILFDGDAFSDVRYCNRSAYQKNFGAFNNSNCTIISDPSNETAIRKYAPSARKIITRNYLSELIKNVTSALQFAFH